MLAEHNRRNVYKKRCVAPNSLDTIQNAISRRYEEEQQPLDFFFGASSTIITSFGLVDWSRPFDEFGLVAISASSSACFFIIPV